MNFAEVGTNRPSGKREESMQMKRAKLAWLFALALAAAVAADRAMAEETAAPMVKIKAGIPGDNFGFAGWFIAQKADFFKRNGIEAEFGIVSTDIVPSALVTGGMQASPAIVSIMHAQFAGYEVRNVALTVAKPVVRILAKRSITTVADLKGKTIVTGPPKAMPTVVLKMFLRKAGLNPDEDVKYLHIGQPAARRAIILSGQADAIIVNTSAALRLQEQVPDLHVLVHESQMPDQLAAGVGVSVEYKNKNANIVKRIIRSVGEANEFIRTKPAEAAKILGDYYKMPAHGKELVDTLMVTLPKRLTPTPELFAAEAEFAAASTGHAVPVQKVMGAWDTRLAAEVEAELYAAGSSKGN